MRDCWQFAVTNWWHWDPAIIPAPWTSAHFTSLWSIFDRWDPPVATGWTSHIFPKNTRVAVASLSCVAWPLVVRQPAPKNPRGGQEGLRKPPVVGVFFLILTWIKLCLCAKQSQLVVQLPFCLWQRYVLLHLNRRRADADNTSDNR